MGHGRRASIRFIRPGDAPRLIELFDTLSPDTVYRRFLCSRAVLLPAEAARYAGVDGDDRDALVRDGGVYQAQLDVGPAL